MRAFDGVRFMASFSFARIVRRAVERPQPLRDDAPLVPGSLRAFDPGVASALGHRQLILPSCVIPFVAADPFDGPSLSPQAARDLAAFGWLRHLDGPQAPAVEVITRDLLLAWPRSALARSAVAREPMVSARRVGNLLAHADAGLVGASGATYDRITTFVDAEFGAIARAWPRWPVCQARLTAAITLTAYQISRGDAHALAMWEKRLVVELDRQVLADGGHMSRNPAVTLDVALDLLPLRRLYLAARLPLPPAVEMALSRLHGMLRFMQHADHQIARFNGMGATPAADLASVMLQLHPLVDVRATTAGVAASSGYVRCEAGAAVLIVDLGPQAECVPGETPFAGALAFEFSSARAAIFANAGADISPLGVATPASRTTSAHCALVVADTASAPLGGGRSGRVTSALASRDTPAAPHVVSAASTCYRERFGLTHERTLTLAADGLTLSGRDVLISRDPGTVPDHPFAIHLRLHPSVYVDVDAAASAVLLTTADGARWRVSATGAEPSIEMATFHASTAGSRPTLQIVLAGRTGTVREIAWCVARIEAPTTLIASD